VVEPMVQVVEPMRARVRCEEPREASLAILYNPRLYARTLRCD